jgi:hypothetical protein
MRKSLRTMEFTGRYRGLTRASAAVVFAGVLLATTAPVASAAGSYYVTNQNVGTYLDSNSAGDVYTLTYSGSPNQTWRIAGGKFTNLGTRLCLASDGKSVITEYCINTTRQQWTSDSTTKKWVRWNGTDKCLHSTGDKGAPVGLMPCGGQASRWRFEPM